MAAASTRTPATGGHLRGTTVTVLRPVTTGYDTHGNPIQVHEREDVNDVLVNKPRTSENTSGGTVASRGELSSTTTTLSLAFPKCWSKPLRGCRVIIPMYDHGAPWDVVGDPMPILLNCPTRWNYNVTVRRTDG